MPRLVLPLLALVAGACAPKLPPRAVADPTSLQWSERVDWEEVGPETTGALANYLRVDTINKPGNERDGALYLGALLDRDGIAWELQELPDLGENRANLIARLPAKNPVEPPLCLLSHIDVVPAESASWPDVGQPLSGNIIDGELYGRGALDMKSVGIVQLQAMALLSRLDAPLRRDVILLAVSDEELDNVGMLRLVEEHWDELQCGHVINEGALGVQDALFEGQTVHAISVGEKGVFWVEMVAEGPPGHGSTPLEGEAIQRLRAALDAIDDIKQKPEWHPMMLGLLGEVGRHKGGFLGFVMRRPFLVRTLARGTLMGNPLTRASLTTTVHLTGLDGIEQVNVVPGKARATFDVRTQPGVTGDQVMAELQEATAHVKGISFRVLSDFPANVSEWEGDPVYDAIAGHALEGRPDSVAGPFLSVGFTDSIFARPMGARAYGYAPFVLDEELLATMHGDAERIPVAALQEGARRMFGIVVQSAVDLEAPVPTTIEGARPVPVHSEVLAPPERTTPESAQADPGPDAGTSEP